MRKFYLLLTALAMATLSYGQVSYLTNYYTDAGNPGGINTESDAPGQGTWTTLMPGVQSVNVWSPVAAIPFPFEFFGQPVTHFKASQNGLVTFDTAATALPNANGALPDATLPDQVICMWDEFTAAPNTGSGDDIRYNTFGTAPNRQFYIKWYSFEMGNPVASFNYFSIVLEETTNKIFVVDQYSTTVPLTPTVGVQLDATTAVMYGTVPAPNSNNGSANPDNDYFEFCPFLLVNDNAAMESFTSIVPPAMSGTNNVDVIVGNTGQNTINSLMVNWSINGTPQAPVAYNNPIASFGNAPVSLGSGMLADGDTVCAWTSMPNGNPDADPSDDTLCIVFCSGLNGVYSIGGGTPDFNSIWEAGVRVNECGVLGPVEFVIAPGTYMDSLLLGDVPGGSALNTVTFNGGSRDLVNVTNGPGGQEAIIHLKDADYITVKNITFDHSGTTDAWGVLFQDSASYNVIDSCRFNMGQGTDISAILASGSATDDFVEGNNANFCTISNNEFNGGDYAIHLEGRGANLTAIDDFMNGMEILNNQFDGYNLYGIYMDNQDSIVVRGNRFRNPLSAGADGIYCFDIMNFDISYNNIVVPDYGIYVTDGNFDGPPDGVSTVINNMVLSSTDYALYFDDVNDVNILHNTFSGNPGMRMNDFFNMDIRNNIFTSNGDYAYETDDPSDQEIVENNLYWTPASNTLFIKDGTGVYADLGTWQGNVPAINSASVEARPFFIAADDLHLIGQNGNDAGDPGVGIMDDIDGEARPQAPSVLPDIGADEYSPLSNDAVFLNFVDLNNFACGDSMYEIWVAFENQGDVITSLPIEVTVGGATTTTLNATYMDTLGFGESDTVSMGFINSYAGGTFTFNGYTLLPGEQDVSDDSASVTVTFIPFIPTGVDVEVCGVDTAVLIGDPAYPAAYEWYDAPTGGNMVGAGEFTVPSITAQSTYYVQYGASNDSLTTTFVAGNGCGGGNMFDVTANATTSLTGFSVNNSQAVGTPITITVHYINNNTYVGNETNAAAWTTEGTYTVNSAGAGNPTTFFLNNPIFITGGQAHAIYVEYNAQYTNGSSAYTDGFLTIQTGVGLCSAFGGTNPGREFNGTVYYESDACSMERSPVTATSLAAPVVDLGVDSSYCTASATITLDAGSGQASYDWSNGDTTSTSDVSATGTYSVVVTGSNGCTAEDTVDIAINAPPVVSVGPDTSVCAGQSVTLSATSSGTIGCLWSTGATTPSIAVSAPGDYSVICTDTNGCDGTDTTNVSLIFAPSAAFTATQNGSAGLGFDFTDNSTGGATSWSWDFGDGTGTSTAQNPSYSYNTGGTFTVTLIVDNGCGLDTLTQTLMPVGIADGLAQLMEVYPNPAHDRATVRLVGLNSEDLHLELYNLQGQRVMEQRFNSLQNEIEVQLDLSGLAAGTYYLRATGQEGQATRKLTIE